MGKNSPSRVLFISYDGLLDQLGGSQILPYIKAFRPMVETVTVLSFEKPGKPLEQRDALREDLNSHGIQWVPLSFTAQLGKPGKAWDLAKMYAVAIKVVLTIRVNIVHARSYQAAQVGMALKQLGVVKLIFDMRGFWVDERIEGGIWSLNNPLHSAVYKHFKRVERSLLPASDVIVSLTESALPELEKISAGSSSKAVVIPCCADYDHFSVPDEQSRLLTREKEGVGDGEFVLGYLGSLGTWYLLKEMLMFYRQLVDKKPESKFLFITRDWGGEAEKLVDELGLRPFRNQILVRPAARGEVPELVACCDVMLSFIKPSFSKKASSPTKLAEAYACGVPVISNRGVGDVEAQTTRLVGVEALVDLSSSSDIDRVVDNIDFIASRGGQSLREKSAKELSLVVAGNRYRAIYSEGLLA